MSSHTPEQHTNNCSSGINNNGNSNSYINDNNDYNNDTKDHNDIDDNDNTNQSNLGAQMPPSPLKIVGDL